MRRSRIKIRPVKVRITVRTKTTGTIRIKRIR